MTGKLFKTEAIKMFGLLFGSGCHVCQMSATVIAGLCENCHDDISIAPENVCSICGGPLGFEYEIDTMETYLCGECETKKPPFDALRYGMAYRGPARDMMLKFKYRAQRSLATPLAELGKDRLAPWLEQWKDGVIIPTPLAASRLYSRGFNPSYLLAKKFGEWLNLDVDEESLTRVRRTAPQYGLTAIERKQNVKDAFRVKEPAQLMGRTVILFDDIYTTGATVAECCKAIKKAKPEKIVVAALCRTP